MQDNLNVSQPTFFFKEHQSLRVVCKAFLDNTTYTCMQRI